MSDNNATTGKFIFWLVTLTICAVIISCYLPVLKGKINNAITETEIVDKAPTLEPNVFSSYESSNCNIVINKYGEGVVFNTSDNYTIDVLKDDMGYVLTTIEPTDTPPKIYRFTGEGWYNMTTAPIIEEIEEETVDTSQ